MYVFTPMDFRAPPLPPPPLGDAEIHLWFFPHWEKRREAATSPPVRELLAAYVGCAPDALRVERDEFGKPRLADARLQFNLSHTASALLLGLSRDISLGVDLETARRPVRSVPELAQRWFTPREARQLAALPAAAQQTAFLRLWTCKEAVLKCSGRGIGAGLDRVEFELSARAEVERLRAAPDDADTWQLTLLAPDADHLGAMAWRGPPLAVRAFVTQAIAAAAQSG